MAADSNRKRIKEKFRQAMVHMERAKECFYDMASIVGTSSQEVTDLVGVATKVILSAESTLQDFIKHF